MTACGLNASLNFSCQNGRVNVQISADLGCLNPALYPFPTAFSSNRSCDRPSKERRRHRRSQTKKDAEVLDVEDAKLNKHIVPSEEATDILTSSHVESDQDKCTVIGNLPLHPPEPPKLPIVCHASSSPQSSTVSPETQKPQQTMSTMVQNPMDETTVVRCNLCQNPDVSFSRRSEFLRHICVDHFGEEHLINFPEFLPNDVFPQVMTLSI